MILPWMLYSILVAGLLSLSAWALEGTVRRLGLPVRGLWTLALLGSLIVPPLGRLLPPRPAPAPTPAAPTVETEPAAAPPPAAPARWVEWTESLPEVAAPARRFDLDRWLMTSWAGLSAVLALGLSLSYGALLRRRRRWKLREVDGRRVWVSEDVGPAVIGFLPPRIVIPDWILATGEPERTLILTHEEEHIRAGDTRLLLGALSGVVLLPWNPVVWWIWRRLRGAVEIDCDLRVLSRGVTPEAYSRTLLTVGERGTARRVLVTALSESSSFLERRIRIMLTPRDGTGWPRALGALLLASGSLLAACRMDRPEQAMVPATGTAYAVAEDGTLAELPDTAAAVSYDSVPEYAAPAVPFIASVETGADASPEDRVNAMRRLAIERYYPNLLTQKVPGYVYLYFLSDSRGEMVKMAIDTEPRPERECFAKLVSRLGGVARGDIETGTCGPLRGAGSNEGGLIWAALKPRPGEENAPPTGPFLLTSAIRSRLLPEAMLRPAVERFHPDALRSGVEFGEGLWFVVDASGQVLRSGRGWTYATAATAKRELEKKVPGVRIGAVEMPSVKTASGQSIPLVWAKLEESGGAARDAGPYARTVTHAVTSTTPGLEVRIRLEGEAASDPAAFRISGHFSKDGEMLVARTPFLFIVVSDAPLRVALTAPSPDEEIQMAHESDQGISRMRGSQLLILRSRHGDPLRAVVNGSAEFLRRPAAPEILLSVTGSRGSARMR